MNLNLRKFIIKCKEGKKARTCIIISKAVLKELSMAKENNLFLHSFNATVMKNRNHLDNQMKNQIKRNRKRKLVRKKNECQRLSAQTLKATLNCVENKTYQLHQIRTTSKNRVLKVNHAVRFKKIGSQIYQNKIQKKKASKWIQNNLHSKTLRMRGLPKVTVKIQFQRTAFMK